MPEPPQDRIPAHAMAPDAVTTALHAALAQGLGEDKAETRMRQFGSNMLRRKQPKGVL